MIARRDLLSTAAAAAVVSAAACSQLQQGGTPAAITQIVLAGIEGISADVSTFVNELSIMNPPPPWLPADLVLKFRGYMEQINQIVAQVNMSTTQATLQSNVQQIETIVNSFVSAAAALPLPPPIGMYVQMAAIALPLLEAALGMVIGPQASAHALAAARYSHSVRMLYEKTPAPRR